MVIRPKVVVLISFMAACSSDSGSDTSQVVAGGAAFAGVSVDQQNVASFVGATRQPSGGFLGPLQVTPVGGGAAHTLDSMATGVNWSRGTTLYYLAQAQETAEGTPPRPRGYGKLMAWLPTQQDPIQLGSVVGAFSVSQDGSAVAFIDRTSASVTATGQVKVWSTTMCTPTCADPMVLGDGLAAAGMELSTDGKHVTVGMAKVGDTLPTFELVTFPGGTVQTLTNDTTARSVMLSADGATCAWVEANQIISAPTSDPTQTTIYTVDTGLDGVETVQAAVMADATHYVVRVKVGTGDPALYLVTAAATSALGVTSPARFSTVQQTASGSTAAGRYLFFATAQDETTGAEDLWVADLQNPTAAPQKLAAQSTGNPIFSDDASMVRIIDNEDLDTLIGDVFVASLPAGAPVMVSEGVRQANFEPGTTKLLFLTDLDENGVGTLMSYAAGSMPTTGRTVPGVENFQIARDAAPNLFYTQSLGTPSDGIYKTSLF